MLQVENVEKKLRRKCWFVSVVENRDKSADKIGECEKYFLLYHQVKDANLLEAFSSASDEQTHNLIGYTQMHCLVNTKRKNLDKMKEELKEIETSVMEREEGSIEDLLLVGKQCLAITTMQNLQRRAEILYFSLQKRAADVSKLVGTFSGEKLCLGIVVISSNFGLF
jgi:hypothetical protein